MTLEDEPTPPLARMLAAVLRSTFSVCERPVDAGAAETSWVSSSISASASASPISAAAAARPAAAAAAAAAAVASAIASSTMPSSYWPVFSGEAAWPRPGRREGALGLVTLFGLPRVGRFMFEGSTAVVSCELVMIFGG